MNFVDTVRNIIIMKSEIRQDIDAQPVETMQVIPSKNVAQIRIHVVNVEEVMNIHLSIMMKLRIDAVVVDR